MSSISQVTSDNKKPVVSYQSGELFDVCKINEASFAIIHKNIVAEKNLLIDLKGQHIVILGNLRAKDDVKISGDAVICLCEEIVSENRDIQIDVDRYAAAGVNITAGGDVTIKTKNGNMITDIWNSKRAELRELFHRGIDTDPSLIYTALVNTVDQIQKAKEAEQKQLEGDVDGTVNVQKALTFLKI